MHTHIQYIDTHIYIKIHIPILQYTAKNKNRFDYLIDFLLLIFYLWLRMPVYAVRFEFKVVHSFAMPSH